MKVIFIVLLLWILSLFFRSIDIPKAWVDAAWEKYGPKDLVLVFDSASFGFLAGVEVNGARLYPRTVEGMLNPALTFDSLSLSFLRRRLVLRALSYPQLPKSYYQPGNHSKDEPVHFRIPDLGEFELVLLRPNILGIAPERVVADVTMGKDSILFDRIHLDWPDQDERMSINGDCRIDLREQKIAGRIKGTAKQRHIRPLLVALDLPVVLPYMDGFTEVTGPVPAEFGWNVNLVNNDADLDLDLSPSYAKYNGVPVVAPKSKLLLHIYTREDHLNFSHVIGPITATDPDGRNLEATLYIDGLKGTNTVRLVAKSTFPVTKLLKLADLEEDYVSDTMRGDSSCDLTFICPETMGKDFTQLNGTGEIAIRDGQVLRLSGFKGLVSLLADKVPGVSWFTDSTEATCHYKIENGIFKTDDLFVHGGAYSIRINGMRDIARDALDFTARAEFVRPDSIAGKIVNPLTWPFTKLLLEYRLTGTAEKPEWKYVSVIDRVLEVVK